VFKLTALGLNRPVAIKAILPGEGGWRARGPATEKQFQGRFLQEAQLGANLMHPAIATVHDFGYHGDTPFTVFEYVAGPTLQETLKRRGRLPLEEVRQIIGPLAQALDFAHSRFVVHRDLKPANIKATEQGQFKILDLGLATEFRGQADWSFCGTPAYASPEQFSGLPIDGRADQYALALITYELLTGERVFRSHNARELLEMHSRQEPPRPPHSLGLPEQVCDALARALRKDPHHRHATCTEFAARLGCRGMEETAARGIQVLFEDKVRIIKTTIANQCLDYLLESSRSLRGLNAGNIFLAPLFYLLIRIFDWFSRPHGYLALTPQALWVVDDWQVIRRWPFRSIARFRLSGMHLSLIFLDGSESDRFLFSTDPNGTA
jgi:serine/threonine protein kinase